MEQKNPSEGNNKQGKSWLRIAKIVATIVLAVASAMMLYFPPFGIVCIVALVVLNRCISVAEKELKEAQAKIDQLTPYQGIADAAAEAARIKGEAEASASQTKETAREDAKRITAEAKAAADRMTAEAKATLDTAKTQAAEKNHKAAEKLANADTEAARKLDSASIEAKRIIGAAEEKAKEIAGDAYEIKKSVDDLRQMEKALHNTVNGYGDEWLKPTYSLLDELADEFSYTDAGKRLKDARAHSARMVSTGTAATCDYVENNRRTTAIRFVVDAFNGKVDSILSKTKQDNYGKLEQQIRDAYTLVNMNGQAFRNARITPEYLDARLQELHWGVVATELRAKEVEEQRRIREQMREEAKAQRDYERAQREAAKEEAMLKKAMERASAMLEKASEEKRKQYEEQLAELQQKLTEAEERNQKALSMAQQTRHGNVYVISNVGSFGENVYKVGMTRRLEPMDRVRELGDASVPFSFDVHAIIESDDAPALEHALHQELALMQVNKVNPRKEFFRVELSDIRALVEKHGLEAKWTMTAEAAEYRETQAIEARMKTDPDAQARWAEFYSKIAEEDEGETA